MVDWLTEFVITYLANNTQSVRAVYPGILSFSTPFNKLTLGNSDQDDGQLVAELHRQLPCLRYHEPALDY